MGLIQVEMIATAIELYMSLILFVFAVIAYGVKELQAHGKLKWVKDDYGFWGDFSHYLKYDRPLTVAKDVFYYRFFKIKYIERFPGSATILVMFTDGFHLMQFVFKVFLIGSLVTYKEIASPVVDFIIYFVMFGITFTIVYKSLSR